MCAGNAGAAFCRAFAVASPVRVPASATRAPPGLTEAETGVVATTLTPTASMEAAPTSPKARRRFKFFFTSKYLSCLDGNSRAESHFLAWPFGKAIADVKYEVKVAHWRARVSL